MQSNRFVNIKFGERPEGEPEPEPEEEDLQE
jgi:hypothetical protein